MPLKPFALQQGQNSLLIDRNKLFRIKKWQDPSLPTHIYTPGSEGRGGGLREACGKSVVLGTEEGEGVEGGELGSGINGGRDGQMWARKRLVECVYVCVCVRACACAAEPAQAPVCTGVGVWAPECPRPGMDKRAPIVAALVARPWLNLLIVPWYGLSLYVQVIFRRERELGSSEWLHHRQQCMGHSETISWRGDAGSLLGRWQQEVSSPWVFQLLPRCLHASPACPTPSLHLQGQHASRKRQQKDGAGENGRKAFSTYTLSVRRDQATFIVPVGRDHYFE